MKLSYSNSSTSSEYTGGRVALLFLLFALSIYLFITAGFGLFAAVCAIPVVVLGAILSFGKSMTMFWALTFINYFIQWKSFPISGIPASAPNELLELLLLAMVLINFKEDHHSERCINTMLFTLIVWAMFCTLEVLNDTCGLGIQVAAWYGGARMMAYQLIYALLVYTLYLNTPERIMRYLYVWAALSIFASFWVWKQQKFGLLPAENAFLQGRGHTTHVINGGATIRYFSVFNDAASFGINMASSAVTFIILGITSRIKKHKWFFIFTGLMCLKGMMPSGTRTAMFCFFAGIAVYVVLSKSFKIAVPVGLLGIATYVILAFTTIGNGNAQIRRMRSGFDKSDASANQRTINQAVMKKYLADAPFGIGIGIGYENVPANNKYRKLATLPPDSEYVFIWQHTGYVGITLFVILTFVMTFGGCWIVFFKLQNKSIRGLGAGLCSSFVALQLGGYANQVLMQFPNCLIFYGGLSLVYALPYIEPQWVEWEEKQLAVQAEKKRIKEEKKRASRV